MFVEELPEFCKPLVLAAQGADIKAKPQMAVNERLAAQGVQAILSLELEIHFHSDEDKHAFMTGRWQAQVRVLCQRCLQAMDEQVESDFAFQILLSETEDLLASYDALIVDDNKTLALMPWFEEELILALPPFPKHAEQDCNTNWSVDKTQTNDRQRPFEHLKNARRAKHEE